MTLKHWTVYTAREITPGSYHLIATTWTDNGPMDEQAQTVGKLTGTTREVAEAKAAELQENYDKVRGYAKESL